MAEQFNYSSVLAPYMKYLISMKESAGYSVLRSKWILKEIDDFANAEGLSEPIITESIFKRWRVTRKNDCERTIYAKLSVWHQLTTLMCRQGCISYIPKMPRQPKSDFTPYIFTEKQIRAILKTADEYRLYDIRMGTALMPMPAILRTLYATGMRVSEVLSIRNKDVYLDEQYIYLRKTKNGSERIVPVGESLKEVLSQYISYRDKMPLSGISQLEALLFVKSDGTSLTAGAVYTHFKRLLNVCCIPYFGNHHGPRVHDLRHTNAVHALVQMGRAGMDLYASMPILSTSLGHRSLHATEQYVRLTCSMYPDLEENCSPINAFIYPKVCKAYDYDD